jgi:uncharacterized protein (DUF2147 family)
MRLLYLLAPALLTTAAFGGAPDSPHDRISGNWLTADRHSVVKVSRCGEEVCGTVVGLTPHAAADGSPMRDDSNPDPRLRDRPACGLEILRMRWNAGKETFEGSLYDPNTGKSYSGSVSLNSDGALKLRGYVLKIPLLGRTELWSHYQPPLSVDCRMQEIPRKK